MADTKIVVDVEANTKKFRAAMTGVSASLYAAGGAASRMGTVARGSMTVMTAALTATAISAKLVATTIQKSSMLFVEYNDTLARTTAIMGGTASSMAALDEEIRKVGRNTRFTAVQVGEAANALAIAGVKADEMIGDEALLNLVKFAIAGGVDIQTATNIGIAGVKAFGMEMDKLEYVSDVLTRTFTRANVDIVSLGEGMKFAAPVAHSAGISIEETASAIGALGNAGLRGTVAGTGLRMSINKLLKPTFDSQVAINSLGLAVQVLSPAGEAAKATLTTVARQLDATKRATGALSSELKMLNNEMTTLSIEQQSNTLIIEKIRAKAAKANRDLTGQEIKQIEKLTDANDALRLNEMTLDLERARTAQTLSIQMETQDALNTQSKALIKTVEQQATGITSLGDVLDQLATAGATTTQILEIFGVRGGTAMSSLLSQREGFHELVKETMNAKDATQTFMESMQASADAGGSAKEHFFLFFSAIQDGMLNVGEPFVLMLSELADKFKIPIQQALKENVPLFKELAFAIMGAMEVIIPLVIDMLPDMIMALKAIVPIITILVGAFRLLMLVLSPVLQLLSGIGQILQGIMLMAGGDWSGGWKQMKMGLKDAAIGGAITAASVVTGGAAGAAAGSLMGGAVGRVGATAITRGVTGGMMGGATAGINMADGQNRVSGAIQERAGFADGGFVNGFTPAIVGEAGPEVIIPLGAGKEGRRDQLASAAGLGGTNINIGDIHINGGSNLSSHEIRALLQSELPNAIKTALFRGTSQVI